jgi:thiosulfate/3-mercaptopyruvate sulfurtransferase
MRQATLAVPMLAAALFAGPAAAQDAQANPHLLVPAEWLTAHLADPAVVVLHVGTDRAAYDAGHVEGARFVQLRELVEEREGNLNELPAVERLAEVFKSAGVGDEGRIVVYGEPLHAARAFFTLDYLGHGERTSVLDGGLTAWRSAGGRVSTVARQVAPRAFTPRPQPERVVDAAWIGERLGDASLVLIDARPRAQYTGEEAAGVERPGHIPGARNIFWQEMLESAERPVLKDAAALREMFSAAGASAERGVVAYCRTGVQASMTYFVARLLGYEVKMYDGSFQDWSRRAELPVAR